MTKEYILNFLTDHKDEFEAKYQVSKIGLFGSYAVDSQNEESDIDIIVTMPSDFDLFFELKETLENEFHKKVDLGLEKNIRMLLKSSIKNEVVYV